MRHAGRGQGEAAAAASDERVGWRVQLPLIFVIAALAAFVLVPLLVDRHIEAQRTVREEVGEPALRLATQVQLGMATQMASLRGFVITGGDEFVASYRAELREEALSLQQLRRLLVQLDPALLERLAALEAAAAEWRARHDAILDGRIGRDEYLGFAVDQQRAYVGALGAAADLEAAILRSLGGLRDASRRAEAVGLWITAALVVLALIATFVLIGLGRRLRRRAREELELRHAALALTGAVGVEQVLERIVWSAVEHTTGDNSYVELVLPGRAEVEVAAVSGDGVPPPGLRVPYPGSVAEAAISTGDTELVEDVSVGSRPMTRHLARHCGRCSAIIVPLVSESESLGALVILRTGAGAFREEHTLQPRILGALAGLALRRAILLREAEEGREAVEQLMAGRSRLMRGLSHDLKNPLGAADGYGELLADGILGELDHRQRDAVLRIRGLIRQALELLEELHEFTLAERGQLDVQSEPTDVGAVAGAVAETHAARAEMASLDFHIRAAPGDVPEIPTDPARVRQVINNLLSNAIKYTPRGGRVEVRVRTARDEQAKPGPGDWVVVEVSDTGPGIPEAEREQVFAEFARLSPQAERGAGLGLAISRSIARLLGGDLTVRSELGRGSTFCLWLPADAARYPERMDERGAAG